MAEETMNELKQQEYSVTDQKYNTSLLDPKSNNTLFKLAKYFSESQLVPDQYQHKLENCFVACELANRMGVSPMLVMQNLYVIKGRPGWSGSFAIAAIKGCKKYSGVEFVWVGDESNETFGCYLQAKEIATGKTVRGALIDRKMVRGFGWDSKPGSMWRTMETQMFRYRAAAFFARSECPEVLMGISCADEVRDTYGNEEPKKQKTKITLDEVYVESTVEE